MIMTKEEIIKKWCILYKGGEIADNPLNKFDDCFKWYMWRIECNAVRLSSQGKTEDECEELFKREIFAGIDLYAGVPFGGDPTGLYKKYFAYK